MTLDADADLPTTTLWVQVRMYIQGPPLRPATQFFPHEYAVMEDQAGA